MIGRAAIGYPWIFRQIRHYLDTGEVLPGPDMAERVRVCRKHFEASLAWKGEKVGIYEMRRHYSNYFKGIPNFKPWRMRLVESQSSSEILEYLHQIAETDFSHWQAAGPETESHTLEPILAEPEASCSV
jgi:tRNA-dihydrouridine synthase